MKLWREIYDDDDLLAIAKSHYSVIKDEFFEYSSIFGLVFPDYTIGIESQLKILLFCIDQMANLRSIHFFCPSIESLRDNCIEIKGIWIWDDDVASIFQKNLRNIHE